MSSGIVDTVYSHLGQTEKHLIDIASVVTVVGTLSNYLPHVAAAFTIVWTAIRIWETDTVKYLTGRSNPKE